MNFGASLLNFLHSLGEQELKAAAVPVTAALDNIIKTPTPVNVAAQAAGLAVALPALIPSAEGALISDLATEANSLLSDATGNIPDGPSPVPPPAGLSGYGGDGPAIVSASSDSSVPNPPLAENGPSLATEAQPPASA